MQLPQPTPALPACRDPYDLPFLHLAGKIPFAIQTPQAWLQELQC